MRNKNQPSHFDDTVWRRVRQRIPLNLQDAHPASLLLEALKQLVPFESYSVAGLDLGGCEVGRGVHLTSTLSREFLDAYSRANLFQIDPLATMLSPETPVARWHDVPADIIANPKTAPLTETLARFRVPPRTIVGFFHGRQQYGGIGFMREKRFDEAEAALLLHFGFEIYRALSKPLMTEENVHLGVTHGEKLCLSLTAQGLTSQQIATETDYTAETVSSYLKSAMRKLNVSNRPHAVAIALRRGIID